MTAIKTFCDADVLELERSSRDCPPGFTGQAGNRGSVWFRVNNGEWEPAGTRRFHLYVTHLHEAESVAEFRDRIKEL